MNAFDKTRPVKMGKVKNICLVAHDKKKKELLAWVEEHVDSLRKHKLFGTGTTSTMIREQFGVEIKSFLSGPVGGDQQIGATITEKQIDVLVFFWDPLEMQPHDPDVRALLRIAVLYDVVTVTTPSTADFVFKSMLMDEEYEREVIDTSSNLEQRVVSLRKEVEEEK